MKKRNFLPILFDPITQRYVCPPLDFVDFKTYTFNKSQFDQSRYNNVVYTNTIDTGFFVQKDANRWYYTLPHSSQLIYHCHLYVQLTLQFADICFNAKRKNGRYIQCYDAQSLSYELNIDSFVEMIKKGIDVRSPFTGFFSFLKTYEFVSLYYHDHEPLELKNMIYYTCT